MVLNIDLHRRPLRQPQTENHGQKRSEWYETLVARKSLYRRIRQLQLAREYFVIRQCVIWWDPEAKANPRTARADSWLFVLLVPWKMLAHARFSCLAVFQARDGVTKRVDLLQAIALCVRHERWLCWGITVVLSEFDPSRLIAYKRIEWVMSWAPPTYHHWQCKLSLHDESGRFDAWQGIRIPSWSNTGLSPQLQWSLKKSSAKQQSHVRVWFIDWDFSNGLCCWSAAATSSDTGRKACPISAFSTIAAIRACTSDLKHTGIPSEVISLLTRDHLPHLRVDAHQKSRTVRSLISLVSSWSWPRLQSQKSSSRGYHRQFPSVLWNNIQDSL